MGGVWHLIVRGSFLGKSPRSHERPWPRRRGAGRYPADHHLAVRLGPQEPDEADGSHDAPATHLRRGERVPQGGRLVVLVMTL